MKRLLALTLLAVPALAGTPHFTFQRASPNNFSASIIHPGIVTGVRPVNCVRLRVRYRLDRTILVENQNPGPESIDTMFLGAKIDVRLAGHLVETVVFMDAHSGLNLGGFDGTVDGMGASGASPVVAPQGGVVEVLVGDPLVLVDIVDVGAFELLVESVDSFGASGPGNMSLVVTSHAIVHGELAVVD